MSEFLLEYKRVDATTWVYLASLLSIGLFFKFNRFWSVRNLDLVLLILLAPGLLLIQSGRKQQTHLVSESLKVGELRQLASDGESAQPDSISESLPETDLPEKEPLPVGEESDLDTESEQENLPAGADGGEVADINTDINTDIDKLAIVDEPERLVETRKRYMMARSVEFSGFLWLLCVNGFLVIRLLIDPNMVRRPLLEPNLSAGGLTFICVSLFVFLMANVITSKPSEPPSDVAVRMDRLLFWGAADGMDETTAVQRPGYILLELFPQFPTTPLTPPSEDEEIAANDAPLVAVARGIAILTHLAIVLGIVMVGYRHFDNLRMGIGAAALYLMLPYTAQMTGYIEHSMPAAFLVWAVVGYRRPATAGAFLGLAIGCYYYPLFLLPLWISFYWQRGLGRFLCGIGSILAVLICVLYVNSIDSSEFVGHLQTMFGFRFPLMTDLEGLWGLGFDPWYRLPVLAVFGGVSCTLAVWPAQKNLGTLISCSGAIMVACQFWHGFGGGLYMGWYLPLLLLTVFRPNLEDRIALSVLGEGWFPRRLRNKAASVFLP